MKKLFLALLALILAANLLFPQKPVKKSVFGSNAGLSIPYNEFGLSTWGYHSGFAAPGPNIEAEFLRYGRIFGFSSGIGYASIFFNEKDYKSEYDHVLNGYGINEVTAGNYQVLKFLVGFTLKIPEIRNTEVLLLFHLGYALSVHPSLSVTNSELGEINSVTREAAGAPISNATLKINYWLNERYGLTINGGVNLTGPAFYDETGPAGTFRLPVRYVNTNIGFVMRLNAENK
ncbi:MAG: hypothetical protein WAV93_09020 [Bacteroidales bacterium]